jgi:hypothetical protein
MINTEQNIVKFHINIYEPETSTLNHIFLLQIRHLSCLYVLTLVYGTVVSVSRGGDPSYNNKYRILNLNFHSVGFTSCSQW